MPVFVGGCGTATEDEDQAYNAGWPRKGCGVCRRSGRNKKSARRGSKEKWTGFYVLGFITQCTCPPPVCCPAAGNLQNGSYSPCLIPHRSSCASAARCEAVRDTCIVVAPCCMGCACTNAQHAFTRMHTPTHRQPSLQANNVQKKDRSSRMRFTRCFQRRGVAGVWRMLLMNVMSLGFLMAKCGISSRMQCAPKTRMTGCL